MNPTEFGQLYAAVCAMEAERFSRPGALATIVRTSGSTFRHAGARMLVRNDGEVVCALSGGCPQRDIVEQAVRAIAQDTPALARYNRDSNLDVLIEMGCGGELEVLIEPLRGAADMYFMHVLADAHRRREVGTMVMAYARDGAALPRPQRMIRAGVVQWQDADALALPVQTMLRDVSGNAGASHAQAVDGVDLLIESLLPAPLLALIGVNAVSLALADIAAAMGWTSLLLDDAAHVPPRTELPPGARRVAVSLQTIASLVPGDAQCAVLAMTFNLERDAAYLQALAPGHRGYLGAIGSRERSERLRQACPGVRVFAPAGLDLGAENPHEIALAIAAEIVAQRSGRAAGSLSRA